MNRTVVVVLWALTACYRSDLAARFVDGAGPVPTDGGPGADSGSQGYCQGSGPPLIVGDTSLECPGTLAQRTFRFALCVCEDLSASSKLTIDAYDSREGPYSPGGSGGSLGSNGRVAVNAGLEVGGSVFVGDPLGLSAGNLPVTVDRRLFCGGDVAADGDLTVGQDAAVNGILRAQDLRIGGTLSIPDSTDVNAAMSSITNTVETTVQVNPPCDCNNLVDIAGYVARHASANDNAEIGLEAGSLGNVQAATRLVLPCGRYYVDRLGGSGQLTLDVTGRAALFVAGDVSIEQLDLQIADGAELDLFVAGQLTASSFLRLSDRPSDFRLYIGGSGTIQFDVGAALGAQLYAPRAELSSSGPVEAFGSLFVRRLAAAAAVTVHYDNAISAVGDDCRDAEPTQCSSCSDCGNQACVNGSCGTCRNDSDCCDPLRCLAGQCIPEI